VVPLNMTTGGIAASGTCLYDTETVTVPCDLPIATTTLIFALHMHALVLCDVVNGQLAQMK
jgi:hypothetical protein